MAIQEGLFGDVSIRIPWPIKLLASEEWDALSASWKSAFERAGKLGYLAPEDVRDLLNDAPPEAVGRLQQYFEAYDIHIVDTHHVSVHKTCVVCDKGMDLKWFDRLELAYRFPTSSCCYFCHRKANKKRDWLLRKYRISPYDYLGYLIRQAGLCAICKIRPDKVLHVDHCHEHGYVRGLLCGKCNKALGLFGDKTERLRAAASYLDEAREAYEKRFTK